MALCHMLWLENLGPGCFVKRKEMIDPRSCLFLEQIHRAEKARRLPQRSNCRDMVLFSLTSIKPLLHAHGTETCNAVSIFLPDVSLVRF